MSKSTKRQRKLEDMFANSSTKRIKGNDGNTADSDKQTVVHTTSESLRRRFIESCIQTVIFS